ncbi:MAG: hypothetical protein II799_01475, partial [Lachnospiraceae bacterium]|nr:hypothetical protein [Lachnospiraceae bacterium]
DTGKDSAEAENAEADDDGTGESAVPADGSAVSEDAADEAGDSPDGDAADASDNADNSDGSDSGNDNNGAADKNSTVAPDKKMSPVMIILVILGLGVAGFVGYRVVKKKGN